MTVQARPSARCRKLLLDLSRYLDGELTPAGRRAIERHIAGCECCGTMAARLRKTVAACRAEGRIELRGTQQGTRGERGGTEWCGANHCTDRGPAGAITAPCLAPHLHD